jgi:hypothetical protein
MAHHACLREVSAAGLDWPDHAPKQDFIGGSTVGKGPNTVDETIHPAPAKQGVK